MEGGRFRCAAGARRAQAGLLWPFLCVAAVAHAAELGGSKPNIIVVLCDDLAMGDAGCYGQSLIATPRIDRMAADGMRFTQAYCGTSVCAPSRASLMTGLHMGHCPIRADREIEPEGQMPLPAGTATVAQILKGAGNAAKNAAGSSAGNAKKQ